MRILIFSAAIAAAAVADVRAETTPYQPSAFSRAHYGYAQTETDANRVRVSFSGNAETSRETVETYLLFRAAELTLERGYDYFVVADHDVEANTQYAVAGPPVPPIVPARRYREITSYSAVSDIIMHRGIRPPNLTNAFDARTVHANLARRISRPN
jgi:hypothetical protein